MNRFTVLAFDLGASNGRAIKAEYQENQLRYEVVHRFENNPITKNDTLYWDIETLQKEIKTGIEKAGNPDSIGFDTWGVDFGLLNERGELLDCPVHYRDTRTDGVPEQFFKSFEKEWLYRETGNQIMPINTLFQLIALKNKRPELLKQAKTLLFMPDLLAYGLTGKPVCERTIASTSQMLNPASGQWSREVLEAAGIDQSILLDPVPSGTVTGTYKNARVVAVAGHDTQCAVAAVPFIGSDAAFLSCGTWSLLGTELDAPVLTEKSMRLKLSNETGANGKVNYLKNIIGLWLIQESRRQYRRQGSEYSYAQLAQLAEEAEPFQCFIDPDDPKFGVPGDIPGLVNDFCRQSGQYAPKTPGEVMRCIYESLAMKYRLAIEQLTLATGKTFSTLHMMGGGIQAQLLCRLTADSCGLPVIAGPVEATALGNIIIQLTAAGALKSVEEGRRLIAKTESLKRYLPENQEQWEKAFAVYKKILKGESMA